MDRSADFVQLLSQFVQQIERGMDSGLRTWANETIRERLEAVEKDLPGPLEEIEIYLRSEGVDRTAAKKTSASRPAAAQDRIYTPDGSVGF